MKLLTIEQKNCIDLIKSGSTQNLKLGYEMNKSNGLGLEAIYLGIYEKYKDFIDEEEMELLKVFPILSSKTFSLSHKSFFDESRFTEGYSGIAELINDLNEYFDFSFETISIKTQHDIVDTDYTQKASLQEVFSKATGIPRLEIEINPIFENY